ncbi:MAG: 16S rRNA (guanine(527)-N(7))-methyltransferase RsmG [Candidatus Aquicultor sp.]
MSNMTPPEILAKGAAELHIPLSESQVRLFMAYAHELVSWNERFNLTTITDERDIVVKHFLDSLAIFGAVDVPRGCNVVDIGAGAGFPGVPIKIARPDIPLALVESSQKKAGFLTHLVERLELAHVVVVAERAEDFGRIKENRGYFCCAVSRAVADLAVLAEYALPLVKEGGRFVSYKAKGAHQEVERASSAINLLGGRVEEIAEVVVPFLKAERYLISITKVAQSPQAYPRKAGTPAKKPLA